MMTISKNEAIYLIQHGYFPAPKSLQIEITDDCPLACPQCYKANQQASYMRFDVFQKVIDEAAQIGAYPITLNGGEPLCHPDFLEMVTYAAYKQMLVTTFISGFGLSQEHIDRLSSIKNLQLMISMNGSTEEINSLSRDGYFYAVKALERLSKSNVQFTYAINWVARNDNIDDLPQLLNFSLGYGAKFINVVCNKITHNGEVESPLNKYNYQKLIHIIQENGDKFTIQICYGILWAQFIPDDQTSQAGCPAGIHLCGVNVEGDYFPCTHLNYVESYPSIMDYWKNSSTLCVLRSASKHITGGKCETCVKYKNCRFCHAISLETHHHLTQGVSNCVLYEKMR